MKVLITGATGFVGRALCLRLARDGHQLTAVARNANAAQGLLGSDVATVTWQDAEALAAAVLAADAVIHLAGEPIVGKRWSTRQKASLRQSRIDTAATIAAMAARRPKPLQVVIGASAIGYYGDRGDEGLTEASTAGKDFAAKLCADWEQASLGVAAARHVIVRIGLVLGLGGGMLASLTPTFSRGLGATLGDGSAWQSWIHLADLVEVFAQALTDERFAGVYNGTAPHPETNRELSRALAAAHDSRVRLAAPRFVLRLVLGEAAGLVLASTKALPAALQAQDFPFAFPKVVDALRDLVDPDDGVEFQTAPSAPQAGASAYFSRTKPNRLLRVRCTLAAPLAEAFPFFADASNLGVITPPSMGFRILTPLPLAMAEGLLIDYKIRLGALPLRWQTRIDAWESGRRFVDCQLRGPYRSWYHEHRFEAAGAHTTMTDDVYYRVPFGVLGRVAHRLVIAGMLRDIFAYRRQAMRLRFGLGK